MCKKHTLGKAQDQRKALLRSLATELFVHGEITTTMARAKALKPYAEKIITLAKKVTFTQSVKLQDIFTTKKLVNIWIWLQVKFLKLHKLIKN